MTYDTSPSPPKPTFYNKYSDSVLPREARKSKSKLMQASFIPLLFFIIPLLFVWENSLSLAVSSVILSSLNPLQLSLKGLQNVLGEQIDCHRVSA